MKQDMELTPRMSEGCERCGAPVCSSERASSIDGLLACGDGGGAWQASFTCNCSQMNSVGRKLHTKEAEDSTEPGDQQTESLPPLCNQRLRRELTTWLVRTAGWFCHHQSTQSGKTASWTISMGAKGTNLGINIHESMIFEFQLYWITSQHVLE